MRLDMQVLERESADFIGLWINVVLNNLKAFQRALFQNVCEPKQPHVHVLFPASFPSLSCNRQSCGRFFRAQLNGLQGRDLLPHYLSTTYCHPTYYSSVSLPILHRTTLYLISVGLFPVNLTSLLTWVPSPLPIQMRCCHRWTVAQSAATCARAAFARSYWCVTEKVRNVWLPVSLPL